MYDSFVTYPTMNFAEKLCKWQQILKTDIKVSILIHLLILNFGNNGQTKIWKNEYCTVYKVLLLNTQYSD